MTLSQTIGIIGGNGWLGGALARAAVSTGLVEPQQLILSSRSKNTATASEIGCRSTQDNTQLVALSDVVILSVRPADFDALSCDLQLKLAISVMAGVSSAAISQRTQATRIVRTMPNAAAAIKLSFTPWFPTQEVTAADKDFIRRFFGASGEVAEVFEEKHIDYCAALTGAGAAYPALLAEALIAHALTQGVTRDFAERAAKSVVSAASQLLALSTPATIVKDMIDYKGLTAAALQTMLDKGFNELVAAGLEAAINKGKSVSSG